LLLAVSVGFCVAKVAISRILERRQWSQNHAPAALAVSCTAAAVARNPSTGAAVRGRSPASMGRRTSLPGQTSTGASRLGGSMIGPTASVSRTPSGSRSPIPGRRLSLGSSR
jgi:hypothetical protein